MLKKNIQNMKIRNSVDFSTEWKNQKIEYIWYSDEILYKNAIIKGFRKSGISLWLRSL